MAKPHLKLLRGPKQGKPCIHWYDFLQSRRQLLKHGKWQGSRSKTKPGVNYVASNYLHPDLRKMGTWNYMLKEAEDGRKTGTGG